MHTWLSNKRSLKSVLLHFFFCKKMSSEATSTDRVLVLVPENLCLWRDFSQTILSRLVLQMSYRDANKNGNCFILFFQFFSYQDLGVVYDFTSNRVSNEMQFFFQNKYLKSIILTRIFYHTFNLSKMKKVLSQLLICLK